MFQSDLTATRINSKVFFGHHWGVAAVSLCFVIFRIGVRIRYFHRIWTDDVLIIVAWLMLCATAVLYQTQSTNLHNHYLLDAGEISPTPAILAGDRTFFKVFVAEFYLWYTTAWMVKLSILLFFRRLFGERQYAPALKAWWWFVTVFTVSTWVACLGTLPYDCLLKPRPWVLAHCAHYYSWPNMQLSRVSDIMTEVMILTIPVIGLWNVQLSFKKKLALLGILCLTVITILFIIIRIAIMPHKNAKPDMTWMCFWAHIEVGAAFIVACLASFRQLFIKSNQSGPHKQISDHESYSNPRSFCIKNFSTHVLRPSAKAPTGFRSLESSLQTHPHAAVYLYADNAVDNPASWGTTHADQDFGTSTKMYVGKTERLVQKDNVDGYPATARCTIETETDFRGKDEMQGRKFIKIRIDDTDFKA